MRGPLKLCDVQAAVKALSQTERGRSALRHVLAWLDDDGLALDQRNQNAILLLLSAAWNGIPGTARDEMRVALEGEQWPT